MVSCSILTHALRGRKKKMNHDNILTKVTRITYAEKISKKNNAYTQVQIHFINGYVLNLFLDNDQKFGVKDAVNTATDDSLLEVDG